MKLQVRISERTFGFFLALWACLIGLCYYGLIAYSANSGLHNHENDLKFWPEKSELIRNKGRFTLVIFFHPYCPCSKASLNELNKIMSRTHRNMDCQIVFLKPSTVEPDWEKSYLWQLSRQIPNSTRKTDVNGLLAKSFNATTSGQTFLYDPDGKLVFSGGITTSRGHEGDSQGSIAIENLSTAREAKTSCSQVFGCPLFKNKI